MIPLIGSGIVRRFAPRPRKSAYLKRLTRRGWNREQNPDPSLEAVRVALASLGVLSGIVVLLRLLEWIHPVKAVDFFLGAEDERYESITTPS